MKNFKTYEIIVLPTKEKLPNSIIENELKQLCFQNNKSFKNDRKTRQHFYLYTLSDDKIETGDWVIEKQKNDEIGELVHIKSEYLLAPEIQKKIIATTDKSLLNTRQKIALLSQSFVKEFIDNYNQISENFIEKLCKIKANNDNTIDLNAYAQGILDGYNYAMTFKK